MYFFDMFEKMFRKCEQFLARIIFFVIFLDFRGFLGSWDEMGWDWLGSAGLVGLAVLYSVPGCASWAGLASLKMLE